MRRAKYTLDVTADSFCLYWVSRVFALCECSVFFVLGVAALLRYSVVNARGWFDWVVGCRLKYNNHTNITTTAANTISRCRAVVATPQRVVIASASEHGDSANRSFRAKFREHKAYGRSVYNRVHKLWCTMCKRVLSANLQNVIGQVSENLIFGKKIYFREQRQTQWHAWRTCLTVQQESIPANVTGKPGTAKIYTRSKAISTACNLARANHAYYYLAAVFFCPVSMRQCDSHVVHTIIGLCI